MLLEHKIPQLMESHDHHMTQQVGVVNSSSTKKSALKQNHCKNGSAVLANGELANGYNSLAACRDAEAFDEGSLNLLLPECISDSLRGA